MAIVQLPMLTCVPIGKLAGVDVDDAGLKQRKAGATPATAMATWCASSS